MLDVRVGEWLCKEGLPLHSVLPEHFGTDVRQSVYRNLKDGKLLLLTGSRFYLHDPDRTLCIEEYYYGQGWGTDIQIDTLHHPVPLLKQIKKTPATAASTVQASPKKKRTRSQATSAEPKDKATARGNKGTGKTGRGAQPWFCKGVELMGNAVNLSDFAAVVVPVAVAQDGGLWEHPLNIDGLKFMKTSKPCIFQPDLAQLEQEVYKWHDLFTKYRECQTGDAD